MFTSGIFDLSGKVAIVTGGNGGLGLGMAVGLAKAGASVAIAARRQDKAEAALAALGTNSLFVQTDVANRDSCFAMADTVAARFGRIDILIANAGVGTACPPEEMNEKSWHNTLDVNLGGIFFAAQAVYPHMKAGGAGKIVTVGSLASIFGSSRAAAYAASKGGVVQLTKSLAVAWGADRIQVNSILPGYAVTDMVSGLKERSPTLNLAVIGRTPAGRWGQPSDFEGAAIFLCSSASDFITGISIVIDGGYSIAGLI